MKRITEDGKKKPGLVYSLAADITGRWASLKMLCGYSASGALNALL